MTEAIIFDMDGVLADTEPIHCHASGKRIGWIDNPLCQTESILRCRFWHRMQRRGCRCFYLFGRSVVFTTDQYVRHRR